MAEERNPAPGSPSPKMEGAMISAGLLADIEENKALKRGRIEVFNCITLCIELRKSFYTAFILPNSSRRARGEVRR